MAIQMRRGADADFRPEKMKPGELAVTIDGTKKVYAAFAAGNIKELSSKEDIWEEVERAEAAQQAAETAKTAAETAKGQAVSAKNDAQAAKVEAQNAADNAQASEADAEAAKTAAEESAKAAKNSQDAAASSEQAVSQKATEAANSAKAAKASQDSAATSATAATTKAGEAEKHADEAEAAAAKAAQEAAKVKTWKPNVSEVGDLSWAVSTDETPPKTVNIIGPPGDKGEQGVPGVVTQLNPGLFGMYVNEHGHLILAHNDNEPAPPIRIENGRLIYTVD